MSNKSAPHSDQQENDPESPSGQVHWINYATFILSVILAILTAGTIVVYYLQLQQMIAVTKTTQDAAYDACISAKIARQTLLDYEAGAADSHSVAIGTIAQASAAISAGSGMLSLGTARISGTTSGTPAIPPDFPKDWNKFGIAFNYGNAGKTAVRSVRIRFTVQILPRNIEPDPQNKETYYDSARASIMQPGPGSSASPNIINQDNKFVVPDDKQLADFQSGKTYIASFGRADYEDTFGVKHWQTFCGFFDNAPLEIPVPRAKPKLRHERCSNYNRSDSNLLYPLPQTPTSSLASTSIVEEITCTPPKK